MRQIGKPLSHQRVHQVEYALRFGYPTPGDQLHNVRDAHR
jgi:hypothetical protein